jgi:hypothetical protein
MSLPEKRLSLLRHFCGMLKLLQVNAVLVRKIKTRPIELNNFKLACDLVRMSHQISSFQAPAFPGRNPGSITAQSMLVLR